MSKRLALGLALFTFYFFLTACANQNAPRTLTVFAAASLTDAFNEIGAAFQKNNPGVAVQFNFAGSQQLALQLNQGARADVLASADQRNMDAVKTLQANSARVFARNRLVVIVPASNPAHVRELRDLAKANLKLVIADASVPVGGYTMTMLEKASADSSFGAAFKTNVLKNVVSQETNVKQVVTKIELGEADAGVVYTTDAAAAKNVTSIAVPDAFNVSAEYPIAALQVSSQPQLAQTFVDFILSNDGQKILNRYGFISP